MRFPDDRRGVTADGDVVEAWNDVTVWGDWGDTKVAILFVARYLLLKQGSNKNEILKAEKCFLDFCTDFEILYVMCINLFI